MSNPKETLLHQYIEDQEGLRVEAKVFYNHVLQCVTFHYRTYMGNTQLFRKELTVSKVDFLQITQEFLREVKWPSETSTPSAENKSS